MQYAECICSQAATVYVDRGRDMPILANEFTFNAVDWLK